MSPCLLGPSPWGRTPSLNSPLKRSLYPSPWVHARNLHALTLKPQKPARFQAPAERQQAAQLSLQQRQQLERKEQQQRRPQPRPHTASPPARRQRRVVMNSSDDDSDEAETAQEALRVSKQRKTLMAKVEEISEQLRAMLGANNINERWGGCMHEGRRTREGITGKSTAAPGLQCVISRLGAAMLGVAASGGRQPIPCFTCPPGKLRARVSGAWMQVCRGV